MNDFREAYRDALNEIETPNINADSVLNEIRHKKIRMRRRRQQTVTVMSVVAVLLISGFTTAKAASYFTSIIRVSKSGFTSVGTKEGEQTGAVQETEPIAAGIPGEVGEAVIMEEIESNNYATVEEMLKACPRMVLVYPSSEYTKDAAQHAMAFGSTIYVSYFFTEDKYMMFNITDYGNSQGHSSSTVYPGGVCNERMHTTPQGFDYKVIDSVQEEGEPLGIHTAISVGNYEIYVDFSDYTQEEVYEILDSMDLSPYLQN